MNRQLPKAGSDNVDSGRLHAVLSRDASCRGHFVYAVKSTGIYCSPGCPSRPAKLENIRFFDWPGEARAAGYRACLRCRPDDDFTEFLSDFVI